MKPRRCDIAELVTLLDAITLNARLGYLQDAAMDISVINGEYDVILYVKTCHSVTSHIPNEEFADWSGQTFCDPAERQDSLD